MTRIDKIRLLLARAEAQLANQAHINPARAEWRGQVIAYQNALIALGEPVSKAKDKRKRPRRDPKAVITVLTPDRLPERPEAVRRFTIIGFRDSNSLKLFKLRS